MTEEQITLTLIRHLKSNDWFVITFDYPQSGTGILIRPDNTDNKSDGFIPDIVAYKNGMVLFFENKDRFVFSDFEKVKRLKNDNSYASAIKRLLGKFNYEVIKFGIGLPNIKKEVGKAIAHKDLVDFIFTVDPENHMVHTQYYAE